MLVKWNQQALKQYWTQTKQHSFIMSQVYTLTNNGSLKRTFKYYYHATPGEPCKGCMVMVLKFSW